MSTQLQEASRPSEAQCPGCSTRLPVTVGTGYCDKCGTAWTACQKCHQAMHNLWRFCPRDGEPISLPMPGLGKNPLTWGDVKARRTKLTQMPIQNAPLWYGGYVWTITETGDIYRISPAGSPPITVENLGREYGKHPFSILKSNLEGRSLLVAVGTRRLVVIDPSIHKAEDEPIPCESLPRNENFALLVDGFPSVAATIGGFAALKRKRGSDPLKHVTSEQDKQTGDLYLQLVRLVKRKDNAGPLHLTTVEGSDGASLEFPIEADLACGPFVIGNRFCLYTIEQFLWLDGRRLNSYPLPREFRPIVNPSVDAPFDLWGRPPFAVVPGGAYLPGTINGQPGFEFVELPGPKPSFSPSVAQGIKSYRSGSEQGLVLTGRGQFQTLRRTQSSSVLQPPDVQVVGGPALAESALQASICRGGGGDRLLRIYPTKKEVTIEGDILPLDIFLSSEFLTLTSLVKRELEVYSWPLV